MNFEVLVHLKQEVLDPEARAITDTLQRLGIRDLKSVQISKRFVLDINQPEAEAHNVAHKIATEYLANPVSESYTIRKL